MFNSEGEGENTDCIAPAGKEVALIKISKNLSRCVW